MAADKIPETKISEAGTRRLIEQVDACQALHDAGDAVATALSGVLLIPNRQSGVQITDSVRLEEWKRAEALVKAASKVIGEQIGRLSAKVVA